MGNLGIIKETVTNIFPEDGCHVGQIIHETLRLYGDKAVEEVL